MTVARTLRSSDGIVTNKCHFLLLIVPGVQAGDACTVIAVANSQNVQRLPLSHPNTFFSRHPKDSRYACVCAAHNDSPPLLMCKLSHITGQHACQCFFKHLVNHGLSNFRLTCLTATWLALCSHCGRCWSLRMFCACIPTSIPCCQLMVICQQCGVWCCG